MKTVIISGGNIDYDFALDFLEKYKPDYIIGVDRGLDFCYHNHVIPNYILGDFDSIKQEVFAYYKATDIPMDIYKAEKDATDTELGVEKAIAVQSTEIYLLGATGTRLDHVIGNLQVLYRVIKQGIACYIRDTNNKITILEPGTTVLKKEEQIGSYISFLPFSDVVEQLTLEGFKYPLQNHQMTKLNSLGVSNEFEDAVASVSFTKGAILMVESRD